MPTETLATELREQGRGVVGALLVVGVSALFTIETWWAGWQLPVLHLLAYAVAGLVVVLLITRNVGFRGGEPSGNGTDEESPDGDQGDGGGEEDGVVGKRGSWREIVTDFFEILVQSFVAAYGYFLLFGLVDLTEPAAVVARLGLVAVVPLGFGAALANEVLAGGNEEPVSQTFPRHLAVVGLGAVFFAAPIAPTEEATVLAATAGWRRLVLVVLATLLVVQLSLYELEFRGQQRRLQDHGWPMQLARSAVVYGVGLVVSYGLLAMFGQLAGQPPAVWLQKTVVLAFPASIGGSAAEVVL